MIDLLMELFRDGGVVIGLIFIVSSTAWYIGLQKMFFFNDIETTINEARPSSPEYRAEITFKVERGFSTMAVCVSSAPLLGLLGTIMGMGKLFAVITEYGIGSPALMADGIALALKATLTGLAAAVAAMFLLNYLTNRKEQLLDLLRKNSAARSFTTVAE